MLWLVFLVTALTCCQAEQLRVKIVDVKSIANAESRIIGGYPVPIERFPFIVQILRHSQHSCGGTLLTVRHVLSAAHCFIDGNGNVLSPTMFSIRAGSSRNDTGGTIHRVSMIVTHERYNTPLRDNDIAVLLLSSAVPLGASVDVAYVPMQGDVVPDNTTLIHLGWGRTDPQATAPSALLNAVAVEKINNQVCAERYRILEAIVNSSFPVTSSMMCSGLLDVGGADACQGDSGGPLALFNIVVGVTSWGWGCAEPQFPGVNARVASYTSWINETVARYNASSPLGNVSVLLLLISLLTTAGVSNIFNLQSTCIKYNYV